MKIGILTKEFPPYIYGGAGVHVASLVKEFAKQHLVSVHCFGDQNYTKKNLVVHGYEGCSHLIPQNKQFSTAFDSQYIALQMAAKKPDAEIIHSHTWYAAYAGFLIKKLYNIPHVMTMHSIEPLRPWKREQLQAAYDLSCWIEKIAIENADKIIAVSDDMKINIMRCYNISPSKIEVLYNGLSIQYFYKTEKVDLIKKYKIDFQKPFVLFVGRITRQKGLIYLLRAMEYLNKKVQLVVCASSPDEKTIYNEIIAQMKQLRNTGRSIIHINEFVAPEVLRQLYSRASIFVCPSIYEPFGIINLEAMACETPVVASAVGGIPEVVVPDETGFLVAFKSVSEIDHSPRNPLNYSVRLAKHIQFLLDNPAKAKEMGKKGRAVVLKDFTWKKIAHNTIKLYKKVIAEYEKK